MTLLEIYDQVQWEDKSKSPARREYVRSLTNQVWQQLCTSGLHQWRGKVGHVAIPADLTGTADVTNGNKSATVAGMTMTYARVWDHVRFGTDNQTYQIVAFNGTTGITLDVAYEGTTDTAATCRVMRRWHRFPVDMDAIETLKESSGGRVLSYTDRATLEFGQKAVGVAAGQPYEFTLASVSSDSLYSTGTLDVTKNSTSVAGTSTALLSARDLYRRLVFRGYPYTFRITAVNAASGAAALTIFPAWPLGDITGLKYDIDPPGEHLFECHPRPSAAGSLWFNYWARMPMLVLDHDTPQGLPEQFHYIIVEGVLEKLKLRPPGTLKALLPEINANAGEARTFNVQLGQYRPGASEAASSLSSDYPFFNPLAED